MRNKQVLVVDDDRAFRIEDYLEEEGLEPVRFYDCESALSFLRAGKRKRPRPLAAFVDMALPLRRDDDQVEALAGLGLMREIRELSPRTELIPLTGHGWAIEGKSRYEILEQGGDLGMLGWITKPASREKVRRIVATLEPERWIDRVFEFKKPVGKSVSVILGVFAFLAFATVWCSLSYGGVVEEIFLPSPTKVGSDLVDLFVNRGFLSDIAASILRVMGGFLLAAVIAVPLGILMGSFRFIDALVSPFCAFVRYMPAAAFIPLIILWLGIGHGQKIAIIFLGIFFYMLILIASEVANVRRSLIETAYTLGASKRQILMKVVAPAAVPGILESLRAMAGAAWTYLIVAELVAAQLGIGYRIIEAQRFLQTGRVIAGILVIGVIGIVTDILFRGLIRTLAPWRASQP